MPAPEPSQVTSPEQDTSPKQAAAEELSLESLRRIERVCSHFEALPAGKRRIDAHLEGFHGLARERLITELLALDEELRMIEGLPEERSFSQVYAGDRPRPNASSGSAIEVSANEPPLPRSERFEFLQRIGSGGIGHVYRVFDHEAFRPLAIKTLNETLRHEGLAHERFRREAILTGTLQHPGIPPIYDRGTLDDGLPFFSMKLVEGQTLADILRAPTAMTDAQPQLLQIFLNIAQTVAYAHNRKVVHRDLKPHNIMVGAFGEVQVMDWGLAKRMGTSEPDSSKADPTAGVVGTSARETSDDTDHGAFENGDTHRGNDDAHRGNDDAHRGNDDAHRGNGDTHRGHHDTDRGRDATPLHSHLTTSGDVIGTLGYMAPEQARGDVDHVGPPADVFGLGAILFEIICGRAVFASRIRSTVLRQTAEGDVADAMRCLDDADAPPELTRLCRDCIHPDPAKRPADAGAVASAVAEFLASYERRLEQANVERASAVVRDREMRKRYAWMVGLGSLVIAVAVFAIVLISAQLVKSRRLTRAERQAREQVEIESQTALEVNEFLEATLASGLPERRGPDVRLIEVIDDLIPTLEGKLDQRPEVEARIRRTAGQSYRWLGDLDASEQQLRLAIEAFERAGMKGSLEYLFAEDRLAGTLRSRKETGDLDQAIVIRRRVLGELEIMLGPDHEETLRLMNNLGLTLTENDQLDEAESILRSMLDRGQRSPTFAECDRITGILNLGDIAERRKDWQQATALYNEVLESDQADIDAHANTYVQMGVMYDERAMHERAAESYREGHRLRTEYLGAFHDLTLSAWRKHTRSLTSAGLHSQAIDALIESERLHTQADWYASGAVQEARLLQAENLVAADRRQEAIDVLQETVDRFSRERGKDHPYTIEATKQLQKLNDSPDHEYQPIAP